MPFLRPVVAARCLAGQRMLEYLPAIAALGPFKAFSTAPVRRPTPYVACESGQSDMLNHSTPAASGSHQAAAHKTAVQLNEAFQLYRRILRANRRALPKISVRRLADAFVKNEFRLHMATASDFLRSPEDLRLDATPAAATATESDTARKARSRGSMENMGDTVKKTDNHVIGYSEQQFGQFLAAWDDYLCRALSTTTPLHIGRTLKPSQRKLLNEEQMAQLQKLKNMTSPSVPR